jgi:hypothetical protein
MEEYTCKRCGFNTTFKNSIIRHLKRKTICQPILQDLSIDELLKDFIKEELTSGYQCEFCQKYFKTSQTKYHHKMTCKKKNCDSDCNDEIEILKNKIMNLENQMMKVGNQPTTINNTYNNCNIQNNVQNNITLENFGKENVEFLADSFIRRCLFKAFDGVGDLTRKIHFNPDKPEYHNVTTTNKKDGFLEVFKNGKWIYDDKNKVLDALIKQSFDIISSHYDQFDDEIKAELSPTNFKRVDRFVESVLNQDKTIQNSLRKCLYLLILNNRHMVNKE